MKLLGHAIDYYQGLKVRNAHEVQVRLRERTHECHVEHVDDTGAVPGNDVSLVRTTEVSNHNHLLSAPRREEDQPQVATAQARRSIGRA